MLKPGDMCKTFINDVWLYTNMDRTILGNPSSYDHTLVSSADVLLVLALMKVTVAVAGPVLPWCLVVASNGNVGWLATHMLADVVLKDGERPPTEARHETR